MKRIKILLFSNLFPNPAQPLRGNFVESLCKEMGKMAEITVISPLPWFPNTALIKTLGNKINLLTMLSHDRLQYSEIPYFVQWNGFDVYYPRYPFIPVLSRPFHPTLVTLAVFGLVKKLVAEKDINIINAHWIYPDGISAVWSGKQINIPVVVTAHGCDLNHYSHYKLRRPQILWALKNSNKITTVSNALYERTTKELGINKNKVVMIPNGVDTDRFHLRNRKEAKKQLGLNQNKKYLLFVGQFHEVKGLEYLIEAIAILKKRGSLSFETILIGDGPQGYTIKQWLQEKGLTNDVLVLGQRPNNEISAWMNACDFFCLPSKREGMPCVILEALSCGLPVIASRVGGIPELVSEDNGILVEPQNPHALADAIETAFKRKWDKPNISKQMEKFSWSRAAESYIEIFEQALSVG